MPKILEENIFKDFGQNLFQRFLRIIVSKIRGKKFQKDFGGNIFNDFGGKLFHRFWTKLV